MEGGGSSGGESGSVVLSVESSMVLIPSIESIRSEFARGQSLIVKVLGGVVLARSSSMITHNGGELFGADGCAESVVACVPRDIRHAP